MHEDYYQNILYPLQDKVISIMEKLPVEFYLTGGTALSRAWLKHRYSDDLDFFVNNADDYKNQVKTILAALKKSGISYEIPVAQESFTRIFIAHDSSRKERKAETGKSPDAVHQEENTGNKLKIDFVNDIGYRYGDVVKTGFFLRTDNMRNILSNKLTALSRLETKDVVDILFISGNLDFLWDELFQEASRKDPWVNPVDTAELLDSFPVQKLDEISWRVSQPEQKQIKKALETLISDILHGTKNTRK